MLDREGEGRFLPQQRLTLDGWKRVEISIDLAEFGMSGPDEART
jgi:hypothetical protein